MSAHPRFFTKPLITGHCDVQHTLTSRVNVVGGVNAVAILQQKSQCVAHKQAAQAYISLQMAKGW